MRQKTKSRTIKDDKWERKKYIEQSKGVIVKDIIKIRLHMWDLKKNYKEEEALCPLCEADGDTTEHVLKYGRDRGNRKQRKERNIKNNTEEEWEQVVQVSREKKKKKRIEERESYKEGSSLVRSSCTVVDSFGVELVCTNTRFVLEKHIIE